VIEVVQILGGSLLAIIITFLVLVGVHDWLMGRDA